MTRAELLALPPLSTEWHVPYLPRPNHAQLVIHHAVTPPELTPTSFLVPFLRDGRVVLAVNLRRGRGIEIPGGHVEPGEDPRKAAVRETREETGAWVSDPIAIAHVRCVTRAEGCRCPVSFQAFHAAMVERMGDRMAGDECGPPEIVTPEEAQRLLRHRHHFDIILEARRRLRAAGLLPGRRMR